MIRATEITKAYSGRVVLDHVSLDIPESSITVILGPNGCGKSTLLRVLAGIDQVSSGALETAIAPGYTDSKVSVASSWPAVTMVFQQLFLWPHMTLRDNIELPLRSFHREGAASWLELAGRLGIESVLERFPNEVSLGQRQAAAIVRSVALQPAFLLMDEVTSALDVEHVRSVAELIMSLKRRGCGICVVTHLLGFAKAIADRVVFMENGKVVESGSASCLREPRSDRFRAFLQISE